MVLSDIAERGKSSATAASKPGSICSRPVSIWRSVIVPADKLIQLRMFVRGGIE
jgi:hypothetical protein